MTTPAASGLTVLLRALAVVQGLAIAALAVLLFGADEPPPAQVSPVTPSTAHAAANPASSTPTTPEGAQPAAPTAPSPTAAAAAAGPADAVGTVLYGCVVGEAGEPITEGYVWFSRPDDNQQVASMSLSARERSFAIAGIAPGELAYRARAAGFRETAETITIPPGTPRLRHDIVLTPTWELAVRIVTPDGQPLCHALREMAKERTALFFVEPGAVVTTTRPDGDFPPTGLREIGFGLGRWRASSGIDARLRGDKELPKDVAGIIEIDSKQAVWVSAVLRHRVLASVAAEPGQTEVTLTVGVDRVLKDLGTIRGRIVDAATKEPVTDARVGFGDLQSGGAGSKVDAQGRFEARDLRPGLLTIEVYAGQRTAPRDLVSLQPGEVLDLGDVPVCEYRTIAGRCEGMVGSAQNCAVKSMSLDPPWHTSTRREPGHASVEADGSFKLYVMEGRYRLRASGAGGAVMDIDTRTLPDGPLVLQLAKEAPLRIDVQGNGESFELAVFDAGGREVYRRDLQHGWKFSLPFLPGDYRIELKDGHGKIATRRITLGEAGAHLRVP